MAPLARWTHFESLKDPRVERTRRHELMDIVILSILAVKSRLVVVDQAPSSGDAQGRLRFVP
ncbi:transposase family protein [Myxococcota bacterium]